MTDQDQDDMINGISKEDRLWAAMAYAFSPILPIIIYLLDEHKNRPFIRAHLSQAFMLGLFYALIVAVTLGCGSILWVGMLYMAFKAYQGEEIEIPIVSDFVRAQGWD